MKRSLPERAVRALLLYVRFEPDWIHERVQAATMSGEYKKHNGKLAGRVYTKDALDYTSFLHPRIPDLPRGAPTDKVENLRETIEGMVRENAAQTDSPEEAEHQLRTH